MIPYEIDPSLHASQPQPEQLGDGFSPPAHPPHGPSDEQACDAASSSVELSLGDKSPF